MAKPYFYVVVDAALSPPAQACQAVHAATTYGELYGGVAGLPLLLRQTDVVTLRDLAFWCLGEGIPVVGYIDRDLDLDAHAVAFHPDAIRGPLKDLVPALFK